MSKIPSSPELQMESLAKYLVGCIFRFPDEIAYFFINIIFDTFWESIKFGRCNTTWRRGFGLRLSFYLLKKVSICSRYVDFFSIPWLILPNLELSRTELPKLPSNYLIEIVTILLALVDQFYFYMHQRIKTWLFEKKIIFELDYYWAKNLQFQSHVLLFEFLLSFYQNFWNWQVPQLHYCIIAWRVETLAELTWGLKGQIGDRLF